MARFFEPGDFLVFQLESGFGLMRVLAIDEKEGEPANWHLVVYEELFPDVDMAEAATREPAKLHLRIPHLALTERAFERTPAARLGNQPVGSDDLAPYFEWKAKDGKVFDRSVFQMLGFR